MTAPAGPAAVTPADRTRTASPLSQLRQTLAESYAPADNPKPAARSAMPPSPRRLGQQSTDDFVMRTSRSVARDRAHQPPPPPASTSPSPSPSPSQPHSSQKQALPRYYTGSNGSQHHWQRPAPIKPRAPSTGSSMPLAFRTKRPAGELFAALPGEVLELILDELKKLHYSDLSSCATCWMRDACSMAMAARKLVKYARVALYESIEIVGADAVKHRHFYHKKQHTSPAAGSARLALLLRTLRASPPVAAIVRSLKVPSLALYQPVPGIATLGASGTIPDDYETLVASVVMACPNLERVVGFHPTYDHSVHSRYFQALSTRPRLKEMTWVVEPILSDEQQSELRQHAAARSDEHKHHRSRRSRTRSISALIRPHALPSPPASPPLASAPSAPLPLSSAPPAQPDPRQAARFLNHHVNWQYLATLAVHCKPGAALAPSAALLTEAMAYLPRLQNLYLSHLPSRAFDDTALLSLPASLRKLSLDHIPGVTADGLSAFATQPSSRHLASLALVHVDQLGGPGGLPALARALSKLTSLASLTLVQSQPPTLAPGEAVWLFPYLASSSLAHLHWDIVSSTSESSSADAVLARSIAADGFPRLRRLRAPSDPDGLFQALCRPQERADLPTDRGASFPSTHYRGASSVSNASDASSGSHASSTSSASVFSSSLAHSHTDSSSTASTVGSAQKVPARPPSATTDGRPLPRHGNLCRSRMAAQARIDASRRTPRFVVNVTDEQGTLVDAFGTGGFVGTVGSAITYHLVADAGASDDKGGLVDMEDFLTDGGEALGAHEGDARTAARVCSGQWNADGAAPQKKDRERWWHTERARWRGVVLM